MKYFHRQPNKSGQGGHSGTISHTDGGERSFHISRKNPKFFRTLLYTGNCSGKIYIANSIYCMYFIGFFLHCPAISHIYAIRNPGFSGICATPP